MRKQPHFYNREEAGRLLAEELSAYKKDDPVIVALPRGGVVIGYEVAKFLHAPLDTLIVRKIGAPSNRELGVGALAEDDVNLLDDKLIDRLNISEEELNEVISQERIELKRRISLYRESKPVLYLEDKTIILVDDGLATGVTAKAAIQALLSRGVHQIIFASPVCALDTQEEISVTVDNIVCLTTPFDFQSVGGYYQDFQQVTDEEVVALLQKNKKENPQSLLYAQ